MKPRPQALFFLVSVIGAGTAVAEDEPLPDKLSEIGEEDLMDAGASDMSNLLDDAVKKLAAKRNEEALAKLRQKDYPRALELLKQAADLDPDNPDIVNNLGYIYYLLGNGEEAEATLRRTLALDPARTIAYINLADLLGREGEPEKKLLEASQLLKKARELQGNKASVILRQARVARLREAFPEAKRFYSEYLKVRKPTDKLLVEIGDFYRECGQTDQAFKWYQRVDDKGEWGKEAAGRIWEIEVERQARQYGWQRDQEEIPEKARELVAKGRRLAGRRSSRDARRFFEEALALAPGFSLAQVELGDLLRREGDFDGAEVSYLRALALDSGNAEILFRLGELYLEDENRSEFARAALFLTRALEIRPDWAAVHLPLARALRRAGDLEGALRNLEIFLKQTPRGKHHREALRLKQTIQKLMKGNLGTETLTDTGKERPGQQLSAILVDALTRARAHLSKGRPDAAMAELRRLPKEKKGTLVLNLEARILHASGRLKEAARILVASLRMDDRQPDVHEQLGVIYSELGQVHMAKRQFQKAASQGSSVAEFHLARLDLREEAEAGVQWMADLREIDRLLLAKRRLGAFLESHSESVFADEAAALKADVEKRLWIVFGVLASGLFLVALAVGYVARRVFGGVGLDALIRRFPDAGPEVQQVLSAVRHEVLKHNTLALGAVMESIERNGEDAGEKAAHFRKSLLGGGEQDAVAERLDKYAVELAKIGRSYGVRVNLRRREPAISLLYKGFGLLTELSTSLGEVDRLGPKARAKLLSRLKKAYHLLNVEGYEAVQQMLGRIRVLEVDEALVRSVFVRVLREPAFSHVDTAPLAIEPKLELPCAVLISQRAFEDIFANLFRNAVQSSVEMGLSPIEIGFQIDLEVDDVTGIERVVFLVQDRSKKELTTAMIRGQAIGGGLGITADLVSRYDGTVDVAPGSGGWSKAVRVKLPVAAATQRRGAA